ncbi:spartin-like [Dreissena polymorpha]|nr:spartin-like [Dreissena polymorpha]XP_052251063.1 spartin-like [Dreissena polymorpha]
MEMPMASAQGSRSPQQSRSRPSRPPPPGSQILSANTLAKLQEYHDSAFRLVEQGLSADEEGKSNDARAFYESGTSAVNSALKIDCEHLQGTEAEKDKAREIQQKLNKTKLQIEYRLQALRASEIAMPSAPEAMDLEAPPSYEASMSDQQFAALGDSIMSAESTDSQILTANATEIFCIPNNVQIFFISPEGYVSAPSYPSSLKVFRFNEQPAEGASSTIQPSAFLQVGEWFYPLQPGSSPAMRTNYGAYVFPDLQSTVPGAAVGLIIPETLPLTDRQCFEDLLQSLTMYQLQQLTPTEEHAQADERVAGEDQGVESTSTKISKGLITAAEYISWGVGKGAEKAGELLRQGSTKLRAHLKPEERERPVDPRLKTGIQYVRKGSHAAVQVSSYLVSKLGQATMALARHAAPHICRQGEKVLPKSLTENKGEGKSTINSILEVAASGVQGFGTVYMGLEKAAKALGKSLANETVTVVAHKYGNDAGEFTENTLYSVGNIAMTAHNANNLGVKAIAKRAAKDAGKAVLSDLAVKHKNQQTPPDKPPPPQGNGHTNGF